MIVMAENNTLNSVKKIQSVTTISDFDSGTE